MSAAVTGHKDQGRGEDALAQGLGFHVEGPSVASAQRGREGGWDPDAKGLGSAEESGLHPTIGA